MMTTKINKKLDGKHLGVDLSVILHKALSGDVSTEEFITIPKIPISRVSDDCTKLIALAKRSNVTLLICTDGKYHKFKDSVNGERAAKVKDAE